MTISDGLMILAVLAGPVLAVQVQKMIDAARQHLQRRHVVFETLMSTRAARLSYDHVRALNMIDIEFAEKRILWRFYRLRPANEVLDAWKQYQDYLNHPPSERQDEVNRSRIDELFIDLLHAMSKVLGYHFDKVTLRRGVYSPKAHGDMELVQNAARFWFVDIMTGKTSIPIHMVDSPPAMPRAEAEKALRSPQFGVMPDAAKGGRALPRAQTTDAEAS